MRRNGEMPHRLKRMVGKMKAGLQLPAMVLFMVTALAVVGDIMYEKEDDWMRTLGRDYDFFGKNREIHTLYLGETRLESGGREGGFADGIADNRRQLPSSAGGERSVVDLCDLRSSRQKAEESYFLLKQADLRYALTRVYLCGDEDMAGNVDAIKEVSVDHGERMAEEEYLQKIISYCEKKELELVFVK